MVLIVGGAVILSWSREASFGAVAPSLAIVAACACWAIDNNLTRKVALSDATYIAMVKGVVAGAVNTGLALMLGASLPTMRLLLSAALLGFLSYGVSLALFVVALRHIGTARTGAYFSTAPFAGAVLSVLILDESLSASIAFAGCLMAVGVWLHLTERHEHEHAHEALEHEHEHVHDEHHRHDHPNVGPHTHLHRHEPMVHSHPHFPDEHHIGHRH